MVQIAGVSEKGQLCLCGPLAPRTPLAHLLLAPRAALCRRPTPPKVAVKDVRAKRVGGRAVYSMWQYRNAGHALQLDCVAASARCTLRRTRAGCGLCQEPCARTERAVSHLHGRGASTHLRTTCHIRTHADPPQIRLQIDSSYASPFNVEEFEVEWRPVEEPPAEWTSVGCVVGWGGVG